jgi:small subunit ribosomal protein S4e
MAHLKRLVSPKFWKVGRKVRKWVVSPIPGPHAKFESIPLLIIVRDILKLADTAKEAKKIIKKGEVWVDGRVRKEHGFPVGLFDVVSLPKTKKFYRCIAVKNGLAIIEISEKEGNIKIGKIKKKQVVKGGKIQLTLHDGKNLLLDKNGFSVDDSLLIELPSLKIVEHVKLGKGCVGLITKGKNSGKIGKVVKVILGKMATKTKVICVIGKEKTEVLKEHFFPVGKEKPLITLGV